MLCGAPTGQVDKAGVHAIALQQLSRIPGTVGFA